VHNRREVNLPVPAPKFVKVSGHKVDIVFTDREKLKADGLLYYRDNSIHIAKEQCQSQQASALLHEVLHAVFYISGLSSEFRSQTEEKIVRALEPFLFQLLRDNPKLIKYLTEA
jgi:hypothetical protein